VSRREQDERFMAECLQLARQGKGYVSPNPLVGSVIVKDGKVITRGYHQKFGEAHAEINALREAGLKARGATLYVNLEPCSHYGKTPPCTDAIVASGIRRVVIGMIDPNPAVKGRGVRALRSAGVKVQVGTLVDKCQTLNEFFIKRVTKGLPFVTLKVAQTLDGKIASPNRRSQWITSEESRRYVHQLRSEYDAVLIGANTASLDDPRLTVRLVKGRSPKRVLLDGNLSTPLSSHLFNDGGRSRTMTVVRRHGNKEIERRKRLLEQRGIRLVEMKENRAGTINLRSVLKSLADHDILSVLVEGGQQLFTQFLEQRLVDRLLIFVAPKIYGSVGVPGFGKIRGAGNLSLSSVEKIGDDVLIQCDVQTRK
jgi:diaminohydroxyphosphoribosylaminopyrimidine deaminase/5-amino-6-(5-phosphoribosylamino)uracil reductase